MASSLNAQRCEEKKKSVSLHPLAIASSYFQDINSELKSYTGTDFGRQKEFANKIVDAQGT